jgi:hypothetical protein
MLIIYAQASQVWVLAELQLEEETDMVLELGETATKFSFGMTLLFTECRNGKHS